MKKKGKRLPPPVVEPVRVEWDKRLRNLLTESQPPRAQGHFDRFCIVNTMMFTPIELALVEAIPADSQADPLFWTLTNIAVGKVRLVTNGGPDFLAKEVRVTLHYGTHTTVYTGRPTNAGEYVKAIVVGLNEVMFDFDPEVWAFGALYTDGHHMCPLGPADIS